MSSFPKEFLGVTRNMTAKDLGSRIVAGGGKYMPEGVHKVRLSGVDRNNLSQNKLTFKYENEQGQEHTDFLFLSETNKKTGQREFCRRLASTIGMLVPSEEAYDAFIAEIQADNAGVFDCLVGLTGEITLARGKGYGNAEAQPDGSYVVRNTQRPEESYCGATITDARQAAEGAGLKRAFLNIVGYKCVDADGNIEKFGSNLSGQRKPTPVTKPANAFAFGRIAV